MAVREIQPTRSELLETTRKIRLTKNGHKILKLKRDGLILEFFNILDQAKNLRQEIAALYRTAKETIAIASAVDGVIAVRSAAYALTVHPEIQLRSRNLMGVVVPEITSSRIVAPLDERGYGIIGTSPRIDEAADAYEKLVETVVKAAELETTMKKLLEEIERTKRRVNALEFKVLPELEEIERFIRFRLEELERDNIFRLKRIKNKTATKTEA
ncbi:MAG: V-type ATP synthase subunit D [Thermoplasmata archaeon]|nr:V-type ATP synthase subunit D [Thermoplasmata archaeon]MCJ7561850.1 V-type ATP synthase subunit D [Thermoplasmata archaeon]TFG67185.1 MAG: V-type ATP synthase subunit D [Methanomassiliicoccus sp.]